jgi:hypothetical protein
MTGTQTYSIVSIGDSDLTLLSLLTVPIWRRSGSRIAYVDTLDTRLRIMVVTAKPLPTLYTCLLRPGEEDVLTTKLFFSRKVHKISQTREMCFWISNFTQILILELFRAFKMADDWTRPCAPPPRDCRRDPDRAATVGYRFKSALFSPTGLARD